MGSHETRSALFLARGSTFPSAEAEAEAEAEFLEISYSSLFILFFHEMLKMKTIVQPDNCDSNTPWTIYLHVFFLAVWN